MSRIHIFYFFFCFALEGQVRSSHCCGFAEMEFEVPHEFFSFVFQQCSSFPSFFVPEHITIDQLVSSPKRLPSSLVFYYASTSTRCLPRPCIQQPDVQWYHLFRDIFYSVCLEPILLLLSKILSPPIVLA